jgi:Flp pilus assembly protein TadG
MRALRLSDERGTSLVEFALILPVLLLVLFGVLDFGKAFNYWNDQNHLAAEGARWAVVNSNPGGGGQSLQQYIQQQADSSELRGLAVVCVAFPTNSDTGTAGQVGDPVMVSVKSTYTWLPFISQRANLSPTTSISGTATMRLEALPTKFSAGGGGTGSCP